MELLVLISLLAICCFLYNMYVKVVKTKNATMEAFSGIDVQLKKRSDLIPNVLTIAKKFMEHESGIFEKITELRTQAMKAKAGSKEKFQAEAELSTQMKALMVNVENYPTLKSDATMMQAMKTYNTVEEEIAYARTNYNTALTQLKNLIEIFPSSIFACCAGEVASFNYFETDEASKQPVDAAKYL